MGLKPLLRTLATILAIQTEGQLTVIQEST
jgi:hypothetical protein